MIVTLNFSCSSDSTSSNIVDDREVEFRSSDFSISYAGDTCNPEASGNNCFTEDIVNQPILVGSSGCIAFASYTIVVCDGGMLIYDMTYTFDNSIPCDNLLGGISVLDPLSAHLQFNYIFKLLSEKIEINNILANIEKLSCSGSVGIASNSVFVANSCFDICEQANVGGGTSYVEVKCGEGCCERSTQFCIDDENNIVIIGEPTIRPLSPNCQNIPIENCDGTIDPICDLDCSRL